MEEIKVKMEAVHSAKMLVPVCHITPCVNTEGDGMTYHHENIMSNKSGTLSYPLHYLCCNFLGVSTKLQKATVSFVMSLCPHGITLLPLDRFFVKFYI